MSGRRHRWGEVGGEAAPEVEEGERGDGGEAGGEELGSEGADVAPAEGQRVSATAARPRLAGRRSGAVSLLFERE
jgi:hypothetical protein